MADILFKGRVHGSGIVNYTHSNPEKDRAGVYKVGYPVGMKEDGHAWGGKEVLPYFFVVKVTDATMSEVEAMIFSTFNERSINQSWVRKINWEVVNSDLSIDGWRLRILATNPGNSGLGAITNTMVENFITRWNGEIFSFATNEVIFDIAVYENLSVPGALQSEGFWGINTSSIIFNEISYIQAGGIHEITADYSATSWNAKPDRVQSLVEQKNGVVNSNSSGVINFTITRNNVLDEFKEEVRGAVENAVYRRQFRISETFADTIISEGGVREVTLAQVQGYLLNRLDD